MYESKEIVEVDKFIEWVPCDLCGSLDYKILYLSSFSEKDFSAKRFKSFTYANSDKARGNIVECLKCGLVYMNPRDKDVSSLYKDVEDEYYFSSKEDRQATFERDLIQLEETNGVTLTRRLLDVGCSYGFFLDVAKKRGWDVYGTELSAKQYAFAVKNHPKVYNLPLLECHFGRNYFDVITLYDIIEHLPSPTLFLKQVNIILRPSGIIAITTPDLSSFPARITGKYWMNFVRMHLYYFHPRSITKLLEKCGFKVIKIMRHKRIIKLGVAVQWLAKYPLLYKIFKFLFDNCFFRNITIQSTLSGNMTIYARKI